MSIFRDLGSKGKILLGSRGNYFQGSGEINALFSGIKGAGTPLGGLYAKASCHSKVVSIRINLSVSCSRCMSTSQK